MGTAAGSRSIDDGVHDSHSGFDLDWTYVAQDYDWAYGIGCLFCNTSQELVDLCLDG
jgi:hypothetical protein